jgi:hypothetical protein
LTLPLRNLDWIQRIDRDTTDRGDRFRDYTDRIKRYCGPGWRGGGGDWREMGGWDPINQAFNAISTWVPQLAYGNPRFRVGTEREQSRTDAKRGEMALNRLVVQSRMRRLIEQLTVDAWLGNAICLTTQEPAPGYSDWDDPPHWPTNTRVPPWEFIYDSDQYAMERWRYMGHTITRDKDDILAEAEARPEFGWNVDLINSMQAGLIQRPRETRMGREDAEDRKQLEYHEVYCPEVTPEDLRALGVKIGDEDEQGRPYTPAGGYHGALFWVCKNEYRRDARGRYAEQGDTFIRQPTMYWGPRGGPYTVFVGYFVPNDALGLAPDVATMAQAEAANDVARAILRSASRGKNIGIIGSADTELQDAIDEAVDGDVRTVRDATDLKNRVVEMKVGGVYPEQMVAGDWTLDLLYRAAGMGDAERGQSRTGITATATAAASVASSAKIGFLALKVRDDLVCEIGRKDLWFLLKDERSVVRLDDGAIFVGGKRESAGLRQAARVEPQLTQMVEQQVFASTGTRRTFDEIIAALEGEEDQEQEAQDQDDEIDRMALTIEPYSMERTPEGIQQHQLTTTMGLLTTMVPLMGQAPYMRWKAICRQVGDMANLPGFDGYLDEELLKAFQSMLMQTQMAPETPPPAQPRIARDSGAGASGTPKAKAQATAKPAAMNGQPRMGNRTGAVAGAAVKMK